MPSRKEAPTTFVNKLFKSFAAVAIFWSWLSVTGNSLPIPWVVFAAIAVVVIVGYWHFIIEPIDARRREIEKLKKELNAARKLLAERRRT